MGLHVIHQPQRAVDSTGRLHGQRFYQVRLLRLSASDFTSSSLYRYRSDVGYNYDASYTSHAHGWSSGPTSALTFYVLGLTVTSIQGRTWSIGPHTSGLSAAEGGFETSLGWFGVKWSLTSSMFQLSVNVPLSTSGIVTLPRSGRVEVNGTMTDALDHTALHLPGGNHDIVVQF